MKLLKTLLEFREYIDRSIYGEWITDKNEIIPIITKSQHYAPLLDRAKAEGKIKGYASNAVIKKLYDEAFDNGWVRVAHEYPDIVNFDGKRSALKRIVSIIRATSAQPEVKEMLFDVHGGLESKGNSENNTLAKYESFHTYKEFRLPEQRGKLVEFLHSL